MFVLALLVIVSLAYAFRATSERNQLVCEQNLDESTGLYKGLELRPSVTNQDGSPVPCACGVRSTCSPLCMLWALLVDMAVEKLG